jgi:hypothetical protein
MERNANSCYSPSIDATARAAETFRNDTGRRRSGAAYGGIVEPVNDDHAGRLGIALDCLSLARLAVLALTDVGRETSKLVSAAIGPE